MSRRIVFSFAALALFFAFTASPLLAQYAVVTNFTDNAAGGYPVTQLIQAADGNFYGGDSTGGTNSDGVIYKMTPSGTLSLFYQPGVTGEAQYTNLIQGSDGNLWGLDEEGGTDSLGSVFKITPAGVLTTVYTFTGSTDGLYPLGPLVQASDGNFYGVAEQGGLENGCPTEFGASGCGTIFKVTPAGVFSVIYTFQDTTDGGYPEYGLVQGSDGNLYGVEAALFFKVTTAGVLTVLGETNDTTDGVYYNGPLVEGRDGAYYATAQNNGTNAFGSIVKVTSSGITPLYQFTGFTDSDGGIPLSGLWAGTDGNFYGTNSQGGNADCAEGFGCGAVYKMTPAGAVTVLYTFDANLQTNGVLGGPGLVQGSNGLLYGTAGNGGSSGNCNDSCGVVFSVDEGLTAPVVLTLSESSVEKGNPVTLSWKANEAIALSQQQCYAFIQGGATGAGTWTGKQTGTYSSSTYAYTGSATITPTVAGTYTYALTCAGTVSGFATLTVTNSAKTTPTVTLTATPNPASVGQTITLKATVTGSSGTPTGDVAYVYSGTTLATAALNGSGVASLPASSNGYGPGAYPITAEYAGNTSYNSANSTALTVTLDSAPTTTTLTVSPNPVTPPADVTLTATVKRSASTATGTPAGKVNFYVSTTLLGSVGLNASGVAKFTASSSGIAAGTYPIIAKYAGDSSDVASNSATVDVTVK